MSKSVPSILIVEDEELIRKLLQDLMVREFTRCQVTEMKSLAEFEQFLDTQDPSPDCFDIILWDGRLPDGLSIDGAIRKALEEFPNCVMVAISGELDIMAVQLEQGCNFMLRKPFTSGEFSTLLHQIRREWLKGEPQREQKALVC